MKAIAVTIQEILAESVVTRSVRRSTGGSGDAGPKGRYTDDIIVNQ